MNSFTSQRPPTFTRSRSSPSLKKFLIQIQTEDNNLGELVVVVQSIRYIYFNKTKHLSLSEHKITRTRNAYHCREWHMLSLFGKNIYFMLFFQILHYYSLLFERLFLGTFQDQLKWPNFIWELKKILLAKFYGMDKRLIFYK